MEAAAESYWKKVCGTMSHSLRLAFGAMITAISTVIMVLSGIIPIGTYAIPGLAGAFLICAVIELGSGWAWAVYAAVSLLAVLLAGDKEAVLCYILLFGCYPIVKAAIEHKTKKPVQILLKFVFFNAAAILEFYLAVYLLHVPQESFVIFGVNMPWLLLLLGNAIFIIYDYTLSLLVTAYLRKFHSSVSRWLHIH